MQRDTFSLADKLQVNSLKSDAIQTTAFTMCKNVCFRVTNIPLCKQFQSVKQVIKIISVWQKRGWKHQTEKANQTALCLRGFGMLVRSIPIWRFMNCFNQTLTFSLVWENHRALSFWFWCVRIKALTMSGTARISFSIYHIIVQQYTGMNWAHVQ